MRVVTLNTWKNEGDYPRRIAVMTEGLRSFAPDVLLLQEVFRTPGDREGGTDTGRSLADALAMELVYAAARMKPRRWRGGTVPSESGLAVLVRGTAAWSERLPLPGDEQGGERIALLVACNLAGAHVLVGCTHLSHVRGDDARRREQLETILAHPRWRESHDLLLLGGDCNATLESPGLAWLAQHESLAARSVFAGRVTPPTFPFPPREGRIGRTIDHLFLVTPHATKLPHVSFAGVALAESVDGIYASDHAAVVADIVVP